MTKELKHYTRTNIFHEDDKRAFALIGFSIERDSCVTLVRCDEDKIEKEMLKWGRFSKEDIATIKELVIGDGFRPDNYSIVIRLS